MHSDNTDKSYYDWQLSALDVERKDTHFFFLLSISFLLALMAITSMVISLLNEFYDRPWWPRPLFEQRFVVWSTDGTRNGKTSQASQLTTMDVLGSMEWQLGLNSRGRHLAKAAGISTSGDNQWYMTAQWRNRTDEWSTEDGVMAILHIISGWQYDAEGIRQKRLV
jgi:hypothetical protein